MDKFIAGLVIGILLVAGGTYLYIHNGWMDMRGDQPPGMIERAYMGGAMDRWADRSSPKASNPIPPTDSNLITGVRLYKENCAVCHGGPDRPVSSLGLSPSAPQFLNEAPDMPENENFWITKHGVRMTAMPAWEKLMSDDEIWTVVTFLGKMGDMDKLSPAVQTAWKGGAAVQPQQPAQH